MLEEAPKRAVSMSFPSGQWQPPKESRSTQAMVVFGLGLGTMLEWVSASASAARGPVRAAHGGQTAGCH